MEQNLELITEDKKQQNEHKRRSKRLIEIEKKQQSSNDELETRRIQQLKEIQETRRLQSQLNMSYMQVKSDERNHKIQEQNKRVKQLLEKFKQEKIQQDEELKQKQEKRQEEIKQKLQQIKEKFKILSSDEIREHQFKYQKHLEEHSQIQEQNRILKQQQDILFSQEVHSKVKSRAYVATLEVLKKEEQRKKEQQEKLKKNIKERFAYDQFVKEHFLPKISNSIDLPINVVINNTNNNISPLKSDSRSLGNMYLRQIRRMPRRQRVKSQAEKSSSNSIRKDYLTEIRGKSKHITPQTPYGIQCQAERLERESKQAYTKSRQQGDKLLIDSIKQRMLLLEL